MKSDVRRQSFRKMVEQRRGMLIAGAFNAYSARIVEDSGFEAVYLTGAGVNNMALALPDLGFAGLYEIAEHTARIRDAVALPLVVDADTGFGNAVNAAYAVRVLERSGADAIQIEDQVFPKRCGHFEGKGLIPISEATGKIKAAVDARLDPNFLIIARTDARSVEGLSVAIERAQAFAEAGADVLFVEAPTSVDELRQIAGQLERPQLVNIVVGGKTPALNQSEFAVLGFAMVLYANAALQGATLGMQKALRELRTAGILEESSGLVATFAERQRLVKTGEYNEQATRYQA